MEEVIIKFTKNEIRTMIHLIPKDSNGGGQTQRQQEILDILNKAYHS